MALKEYKPGTAFSGTIGRTYEVSSPAWPQPKRTKEYPGTQSVPAGAVPQILNRPFSINAEVES